MASVRLTRALAVVFAISLLLCVPSWALGTEPRDVADVLVRVDSLDTGTESLQPVILSALRYALTRRGLAVATEQTGEESRLDASPISLQCRYSAANSRLSVFLEWHDLQKGGEAATSQQSGPLNLSADSVVLRAVDSLVGAVSGRIDELATARAARVQKTILPGPTPLPGGSAAAGAQPAGPGSPPLRAAAMRVVLTTGFAPFIPVGPASYYFTYGLLPSVVASLKFPTGAGAFAIGLYAAANYFSATGLTDSSDDLMIAVGPDARYELGGGSPLLAFAHLSAGPALLLMRSAAQGGLMDITAFVKSGIGGTLSITGWLGISLSADYEVYFEMPYLIMGFSPALMVNFLL